MNKYNIYTIGLGQTDAEVENIIIIIILIRLSEIIFKLIWNIIGLLVPPPLL